MALHDSMLEEFGLSPLWVRRGMAPVGGEAAAVDSASAAAVTAPPVAQARDAQMPEAQARQADADAAQTRDAASSRPSSERSPREPSPQPLARAEPTRRTADSAPPPRDDMRRAPSEARPTPTQGQSTRAPVTGSPAASEMPPDDDFAWFDDLPTAPPAAADHVHADARADARAVSPVATLDWDALSERVAGCEQCRLCEKRTHTVFGVGDRNADWMLIGEAPGENEDRQGEPFVGQAGKLLDNMLRSLTLARDTNVYIANVIKCRPPGNRNPEPDEVARCEPYLQRQVALVKPKLIVALGRFAAQSLLRTDASISSLRGRVHEYEGVPVIVTYHPAYLLRSLPDKAKAWADLCLARDTSRKAGGAAGSST